MAKRVIESGRLMRILYVEDSAQNRDIVRRYLGDDYEVLSRLGGDLRFVLITSRATVHRAASEDEQHIDVSASLHDKCERCWHYREDVAADAAHPTLCGRCVSNLFGGGEARSHA